jgi:hypothetical protein
MAFTKQPYWRTVTNVGILLIALLLCALPKVQIPVMLKGLTRNDHTIPPPSFPLFNARTMEQVTLWWQQHAHPAYSIWYSALIDTLHDSSKAAHSWSRLCYWTALPLLRLLYYFVTVIFLQAILYDMVLVQGLHWSPHLWRQVQTAGRALGRWQWSRTPQQVLLEVAVLAVGGGLYQLQRRGYWGRFQRAVARRGQRLQQVRVSFLLFCCPTGICERAPVFICIRVGMRI